MQDTNCRFRGCSLVVTTLILTLFVSTNLLAQSRTSNERTNTSDSEVTPLSEKKIFSGPQVGESLGEVPVWVQIPGDKPSGMKDLGELGKKSPIAIAFMHERSRPAFGMGKLMAAFAATKKEEKLQLYFVILTDDRSSSEKWLGQIRKHFKPPAQLAIADGGIEGPGSLGLNRLVAMTILVAKEGKVTGNFALTQVSNATDGPGVLKAMNEVSGGGKMPTIEELMPRPKNRMRAKKRQ